MLKNNAIKISDLTVSYREMPVLWDVDLEVKEGSFFGILGPNGAGKTTLLKVLLGFLSPDAGEVSIFNEPAKKMLREISYVPQKNTVDWDFPATVLDVVLMGLYAELGFFRRIGEDERKRALKALEKVEMLKFVDAQINELSGGQQQRVFLARSLVRDVRLLVLDEPFQGVDARSEKLIVNILRSLRDKGKTILVVHHNLQTVEEYFDHILFLNRKVVAVGETKKIFTKANIEHAYV